VPKTRLDRWLAPWVFVLTGIVFNILAAVITHFFIGLDNEALELIDRDISRKQVLIDSQWQSRIEIERKKEFFTLLLVNSAGKPATIDSYYRDYLNEFINAYGLTQFEARMNTDSVSQLDLLLDISDRARATIIETINTTYLKTLDLHDSRMPLERANSRLLSVAIFLQLIGLTLVLARDLRRSQD